MRKPPPPFRFEAASSTPWRIVCAAYGLPVTGTSTAITRWPVVPLDDLPPHPAPSSARPARRNASRRTAESLQTGCSEIGLLNDAAGGHLGEGALGDDRAGAEDEHAVGDASHQPQVVLDHEHGDSALADPLDRPGDGIELVGTGAGGELVDEEDLRLARKRCGERDQSPLGARQLRRRKVGGVRETDERKGFERRARGRLQLTTRSRR